MRLRALVLLALLRASAASSAAFEARPVELAAPAAPAPLAIAPIGGLSAAFAGVPLPAAAAPSAFSAPIAASPAPAAPVLAAPAPAPAPPAAASVDAVAALPAPAPASAAPDQDAALSATYSAAFDSAALKRRDAAAALIPQAAALAAAHHVSARNLSRLYQFALRGILEEHPRALVPPKAAFRALDRVLLKLPPSSKKFPDRPAAAQPVAAFLSSLLARLPVEAAEKAADAGLTRMLASLDAFTAYLAPDDSASFKEGIRGDRPGLGFAIAQSEHEPGVFIARVLPSSPAERAGFRPGDLIVSVDGKAVPTRAAASAAIDEAEGPMRISFRRDGAVRDIVVSAGRFHESSARGQLFPGGRGYILLKRFTVDSDVELLREARSLRRQGASSLILDLRFNLGGNLETAMAIAAAFLNKGGDVARQESRTEIAAMRAPGQGEFADLPLVVLINRHSASASELVTLALRDNGRATVVGERSYGKGSGQHLYNLANGGTAKITTFLWHGPASPNVGRTKPKGIRPDVLIETSDDDMTTIRARLSDAMNAGVDLDPAGDAALAEALGILAVPR